MFQVYLPIAEISVNLLIMLGLGAAVGFLSGMFGVGGGFLLTPLLMFSGIPPAIAVATGANQIVATSVSGALAQWRRNNIDFHMGAVLIAGGVLGALLGVLLVRELRAAGQAGLIISLTYVALLSTIGVLMLVESVRSIRRARAGKPASGRKPGQHLWVHRLPLKLRFPRSRLYISAIPPFVIGAVVGLLTAFLGVGGGFIMVPAMIYLLRMPTNVVIGTSIFQIIFVTAVVTALHAGFNQTLDLVLALILAAGGVIGGQFGVTAGQRLRGEQLRALLAIMVLAVAIRLLFDLVLPPGELYSISPLSAGA
ncbi:MAG TPA: sulfite exporter TauE/SafE family protein [Methyloceanibacter sp.]|nr:sulfite exporter TauE/SafE family protein [Methyloceanibacter sp.]